MYLTYFNIISIYAGFLNDFALEV